jgi:hypothetical protein
MALRGPAAAIAALLLASCEYSSGPETIGESPQEVPVAQSGTVVGLFATADDAALPGHVAREFVSFGFAVDVDPIIHLVPAGTLPPPECPGTSEQPGALEGNLCLFEGERVNVRHVYASFRTARWRSPNEGFDLTVVSMGAGRLSVSGSWALTVGGT